jgi:beta-glucosidase
MIRFRLGLFDPASMVKWAQTPASVLESPEHKAHALKMARQSVVLLKNEKGTLPLKKSIKKIAVVGPNADNAIAVLGNYNGTPSNIVTALQALKTRSETVLKLSMKKQSTLRTIPCFSMPISVINFPGGDNRVFQHNTSITAN